MKFWDLLFDDVNDEKFAEHHVQDWEVYQVFIEAPAFVANTGAHEAEILMIGPTHGGRFLTVPLKERDAAEGLWRPVTAWESDANELARYERAMHRR